MSNVSNTNEEGDWYNQKAQQLLAIPYLYPYQRLLVDYVLHAGAYWGDDDSYPKNCLALLPTGAGKSLCFTLPALLFKLPSLIIYPLRSLLLDQQRRLEQQGIAVALLIGGQNPKERQQQWQKINSGEAKIIISNPETILQARCRQQLEALNFSQIVLDEAHTLVEWGESFRPAYLELAAWLKQQPKQLICAYTATASEYIQRQLQKYLLAEDYYLVQADADRPNIHYQMLPCLSKAQQLLQLIATCPKPLLIFSSKRRDCEQLALMLKQNFSQLQCRYYHAGLQTDEKKQTEEWFFKADNAVMIATCAYGMGVDKGDIRTVIHYQVPGSIEAYLQESGRAGRDRKSAQAIMLYGYDDYQRLEQHTGADRQRLAQLLQLAANSSSCRRKALLHLLGSSNDFCSGCDVCDGEAHGIPVEWQPFYRALGWRWRCLDTSLMLQFLQGRSSRELQMLALHHHPSYASYQQWDYLNLEEAIVSFFAVDWLQQSILKKKRWWLFSSLQLQRQQASMLLKTSRASTLS